MRLRGWLIWWSIASALAAVYFIYLIARFSRQGHPGSDGYRRPGAARSRPAAADGLHQPHAGGPLRRRRMSKLWIAKKCVIWARSSAVRGKGARIDPIPHKIRAAARVAWSAVKPVLRRTMRREAPRRHEAKNDSAQTPAHKDSRIRSEATSIGTSGSPRPYRFPNTAQSPKPCERI